MRRFVGKFVGTILGFALAGAVGAVIGFIIGHLNDLQAQLSSARRSRAADNDIFPDFIMNKREKPIFATSIIILGAKLAKVDGHVSREEVLAFRKVFRSPESRVAEVGRLFDDARRSSEGYEPYAARLAQIFGRHSPLLEEVMVGLFYIAIADSNRLSRPEILFLRRVAVIFGFPEEDFIRIAGRVGISMTTSEPAPKKDSAYDALGLPTTASDEVIKKTYRALIRKHHPDKLLAAGLPADKVAQATERMKVINAAYSEICKMRNLK